MANLNNKPLLSKKQIEQIEIPYVEHTVQKEIIEYTTYFESTINKLELDNKNIHGKDIMSIISQIYNL